MAMAHIGPMSFNAARFALAAVVLLPLVFFRRGRSEPRNPGRLTRVLAGALAGATIFGGASFQQIGLVYTTAGEAGFITGLYVVIVPLLGYFVRQRATPMAWAGALLASAGLYLLVVDHRLGVSTGNLLELGGALFWAAHILVLGWISPRVEPTQLAISQFASCALLSGLAAVVFESTPAGAYVDAAPLILYGGAISVGVGYTLQVVGQRRAPSSHAAVILSLEAVFAALAGWAILGETLSTWQLAGCALMMGGMVVTQVRGPEQRRVTC